MWLERFDNMVVRQPLYTILLVIESIKRSLQAMQRLVVNFCTNTVSQFQVNETNTS